MYFFNPQTPPQSQTPINKQMQNIMDLLSTARNDAMRNKTNFKALDTIFEHHQYGQYQRLFAFMQQQHPEFNSPKDIEFIQKHTSEQNLPTVQAGIVSCVEDFIQTCTTYFSENWTDVTGWITANFNTLYENIKRIGTFIKNLCSAGSTLINFAVDPNFFTLLAMLLIYSIFTLLNMEQIGFTVLSFMCATLLTGEVGKYASIITWSCTAWRVASSLKANTNVNIVNNIPTVQGFSFHPLLILCSLAVSSLFGLTTFGADINAFKAFAIKIDSHMKIVKGMDYLSGSILGIFEAITNYMGFEFFGIEASEGTLPVDILKVFNTLKEFTPERRRQMVTDPHTCVIAEKLYTSYMNARLNYRTNRPIMLFLDKLQTPIFNLYSRACSINPKSSSNRVEPVVVMLHGESGVGKSTLLYHIGAAVLNNLGYLSEEQTDEEIDEMISNSLYARMIEQEFWDGYLSHPCVLVDDFGQKKDSVSNPNDEFMELIRMSNSFPYPLHMAAVEKKDSTIFNSRVVVATTNLRILAPTSIVSIEAVERRIDMPLHVTIHPDFADDKGRLRDEFKTGGINTDVYQFQFWNTTTGTYNPEILNYDQMIRTLTCRMDKKAFKFTENKHSVVKYARSLMRTQGLFDFLYTTESKAQAKARQLELHVQAGSDSKLAKEWAEVRSHMDLEQATRWLEEFRMTEPVREEDFLSDIILTLETEESYKSKMWRYLQYALAALSIAFAGHSIWTYMKGTNTVTAEIESGKDRHTILKKAAIESGKDRQPVLRKSKVESGKDKAQLVRKPTIEGWISNNSFDTAQLIKRNTKWFYFGGLGVPVPIIFLADYTFALNKHYANILNNFAKKEEDMEVVITSVGQSEGTKAHWSEFQQNEYFRGEVETDLILVTAPFRKFSRMPNISAHIAHRRDLHQLPGKNAILVVPNGIASNWSWHEKFGNIQEIETKEYYDFGNILLKGESIVLTMNSAPGDCGGAHILDSTTQNHRFIGIHFAGDGGIAYSVPLTIEDINETLGRDIRNSNYKESVHALVDPQAIPSVAGNVTLLGKLNDAPQCPTKTKIEASKIFNKITETKVAPAKMSRSLAITQPLGKGIQKQFGPTEALDGTILQIATQDYAKTLAAFPVRKEEIKVLDFETAAKGEDDNDYIKGINRSRSAGYPWINQAGNGKRYWFGENTWTLDSAAALELKAHTEEQIAIMSRGEQVPYLFVDTLKDETRPLEKVIAGKTRVFAAAPMDFIIVFRQYFLCFIAHMMKHRIRNESAVGIRAQSYEWSMLAKKLQTKGNDMIAGDFSNYDGSLNAEILWNVLDIIESWYSLSEDYKPEDAIVRRMLWENVVNSKHIVGDYVYQLNHSQPSGNPATAVLNSMYNSLSMRYVFFKNAPSKNISFTDHVSMIAYGDDNVLGVSPRIHEWFNQDTITDGYAEIGMTYTDELKTGTRQGFKPLESCNFLKRGFSYDRELFTWMAPLCLDSILECFNWIHKTENERDVMAQNARMAFAELAMHDAQTFQQYRTKIRKTLMENYSLNTISAGRSLYRAWIRDGSITSRVPELNWA